MTGGRLTGSTDLLTYYGLVTCYKKYISQTIDPTLFSFVADLPGKTTVEPDGYLMDLLHDPHIEADSANTIRPLDMATLKESYHLREGPVPGFDVSLLGTDDDGGRNSGQYIDKDVYGISDGERKHKKKVIWSFILKYTC
ncbi:uncharacterized protein BX664DRAFT_320532 [Halteromyces radiatus]|uniref:uncharacterized protein n=1 Tax=Halteromyces radiatus TaxID=101107 RepID=UPI00221E9DA5|nr:uncharacterized protein BX664DRAFT_320532 [Halteromyces radiatus]KAI8099153.1 hypothetical protein BX664DRAFT_320532 [Halteromyces radiatus]